MNTPICDFVQKYQKDIQSRFHMPGHKGQGFLSVEEYDITEVKGADSLYEADGIIKESEENATKLFNSALTIYSCEGSSLSIRAMLYLLTQFSNIKNKKRKILAGRNAHKTFVLGCALLNIEVQWIYPNDNYLRCTPSKEEIEQLLSEEKSNNNLPSAIYLTSPDYLGNICDIQSISEVCHKYGVLLLVDNAHGAYLHFTNPKIHPLDLGADICTDSAHKTLPVLTGGAYLHISNNGLNQFGLTKEEMRSLSKTAMALFGSTSPSYLILQSLDYTNYLLASTLVEQIKFTANYLTEIKKQLIQAGYQLIGDEPLKLTLCPKSKGYSGIELANILREKKIECEFADPDYIVFMISPNNSKEEIIHLKDVLLSLENKQPITTTAPTFSKMEVGCDLNTAIFSLSETVSVKESLGKILASVTVGCPPAVPIVMCGEIISQQAIKAFKYYNIETVNVIKKEI